jgi:O-antigen/teichoic acid export membrane protein
MQDVGTYNVAYSAFMNISMFLLLVHTVFLPLIVEYRTKKKIHLIKGFAKKIPLFVAGWTILVLFGLMLSNYLIPLIFSSKYSGSIPSFNVLLIASVFYFVAICVLPLINAFDLVIYAQIFNLIKAAVNISLDFLFVPKMGIIGAAYATMASYFVGMILSIAIVMIKKKKIFIISKE